MKILLVHDYGTPTGGAEMQIISLRDDLRARGHDARLLTSNASLVPSQSVADYGCFGTTSKLQVLSQTANLSAYITMRRVLAEFKPDVVHVRMFLWQLSPLILPLLRNIPCLYQAVTYKAICPVGTKMLPDGSPCNDPAGLVCLHQRCLTTQSWALMMLQRRLWLRWRTVFDRVVTLSQATKQQLEAEGIDPVEVIHNGVPERPARPQLAEPPTIAFAGRLASEKGIDVLLKAVAWLRAEIPNIRLLIAGHGPERSALEALSSSLGLTEHVNWLGYLPREKMEQEFNAAWVQVVPSLWAEPFGNVATEGMMRGTAVVGSTVGGLIEIIQHGETGFLVPPGDPAALMQALRLLLSNRDLAERLGQAGRTRALSLFSEKQRTDRFEALYCELLRKSSTKAVT